MVIVILIYGRSVISAIDYVDEFFPMYLYVSILQSRINEKYRSGQQSTIVSLDATTQNDLSSLKEKKKSRKRKHAELRLTNFKNVHPNDLVVIERQFL